MIIPCEQCEKVKLCSKKIIIKMYNVIGEGRKLHISDSVLVITCKEYREFIVISEDNYVSCMNFFLTKLSKPDDFCNKFEYKPYKFWRNEIISTYHRQKLPPSDMV
jgi:hypothetical protein